MSNFTGHFNDPTSLNCKFEVGIQKIEPETEKIEITPSKEEQIKTGLFDEVKVLGDENLVAENIKKDVDIFGVVGTAESGNAEMLISSNNSGYIQALLTKIPPIDTSNLTTMDYFFENCKNLAEIPQIDTSNATSMYDTFYRCNNLKEVPFLNTSKVTRFERTFYYCETLEEIPQIDTSQGTTFSNMFGYCSSLKEIPILNTGKATSFSYMFIGCRNLEKIPELNASTVNNVGFNCFAYCQKLATFGGFKNIGKAYTQKSSNYTNYTFSISSCKALTYDSIMNVFNSVYDLNLTYDVANGGTLYTQQLIIGPENTAKLAAEEIAIATNKGWTVS